MWWPFGRTYPACQPEDVDSQAYDYIIIGGGTAGCVLASRLSEDSTVSVLLLERGKANDTWLSRCPVMSQNALPEIGYMSLEIEPLEYCNKRQDILAIRAEVIGGGSRINGTIYQRGSVADYDNSAALGHPDWSYEKVQPYFVKSERTLDQPKSWYRGTKGPWTNQKSRLEKLPLRWFGVFHNAAVKLGFPQVPDANSPYAPADGVATFDVTVDENGERMSTSRAFLPIEMAHARKGHLAICPDMIVTRIEFSGNKELKRAERVHFQPKNGEHSRRSFSARIRKEAIICSGAFGSPQVLMLSGIGPREHLEELGISVVHDLPGVGSQLHDHVSIPIMLEVPKAESFGIVALSIWALIIELLKYIFFRIGLFASPVIPVSLFVRSSSIDEKTSNFISQNPADITKDITKASSADIKGRIPDIEIMALAGPIVENGSDYVKRFPSLGIVSLFPTLLQPKSRGSVRLASANPYDNPKIDFGFFSDPTDYGVARKAVRLAIKCGELMKAQGFPIVRNHLVPDHPDDDKNVDEFVRQKSRSIYHYTSTCRMAPENDPEAPGVVDDELRVYGLENLRVADASVFPNVLAAHMQAPTVMVAERCADFLKRERSKELI